MSSKIPCAHFSDINVQGDLHGETESGITILPRITVKKT